MKKVLFSALAAFGLALGASAAGELVASGADVRTWRLGEVGGGTLTNAVLSLAGLSALWEVVSTNGITSTVTNYTTAAAGGTVTLKNSFGDTWTLNLSDGAASTNATPDLTKLVFAGDLELSTSQAERLDFRMVYLTFQQ